MNSSLEHRRTLIKSPAELPKGINAWVASVAGLTRRTPFTVSRLRKEAGLIHAAALRLGDLSPFELQEKSEALQVIFRRRNPRNEPVSDALAVISEIARRRLGLRAHPVQIMGALALSRGLLPEMATGEGKTLTLALAVAMAAWRRLPCHVVTANDYLAARDAEWLREFLHDCGLTAGSVIGEMPPRERVAQYACDVTYTTSKELVADFLRDRLQLGNLQNASRRQLRLLLKPDGAMPPGLVMRGLNTVFVDEADNLMIDEAVTPLIISHETKNELLVQACNAASVIAADLQPAVDYLPVVRAQEILLTESGMARIEARAVELPRVFRGGSWRSDLVTSALRAREFYHRDKNYVVQEGKVVIVDEFTGRLMPMRSWQAGLHQAVEAKEGLEITSPNETLSKLSFQRFFRLFKRISGLTGTAQEAANEFWFVYGLAVIAVPTNRPCLRQEMSDRYFRTASEKWDAVVESVVELHKTGRPILVGTRSIRSSELLASMLQERGLEFSLLNAVRHAEEAGIIGRAGEYGRITIATNMAGRGTDIKLAGNVESLGGLHVIATERHESRRIDRQLFGRAGRQGDKGSAQAFVSLEDELFLRHLPGPVRDQVGNALRLGGPGANKMAGWAVTRAQSAAQKIAFSQRKSVMLQDTWADDALSFAGSEFGI